MGVVDFSCNLNGQMYLGEALICLNTFHFVILSKFCSIIMAHEENVENSPKLDERLNNFGNTVKFTVYSPPKDRR